MRDYHFRHGCLCVRVEASCLDEARRRLRAAFGRELAGLVLHEHDGVVATLEAPAPEAIDGESCWR